MTADHDDHDDGRAPPIIGRSPQRRIRIPQAVWAPAMKRAYQEAADYPSHHLSTLITDYLRRYANGENP